MWPCLTHLWPTDKLPDDIAADIESARRQLEALEDGVDYERTIEVRSRHCQKQLSSRASRNCVCRVSPE